MYCRRPALSVNFARKMLKSRENRTQREGSHNESGWCSVSSVSSPHGETGRHQPYTSSHHRRDGGAPRIDGGMSLLSRYTGGIAVGSGGRGRVLSKQCGKITLVRTA